MLKVFLMKTFRQLVLRKTGEFVFQLNKEHKLKKYGPKVRLQLCNEITGICYREAMG